MYQLPEPTPPTLELLTPGVQIPGLTAVAWTSVGPRITWTPEVRSNAETAECTCPTDCIRDHETD
jgi:hypothetical protein